MEVDYNEKDKLLTFKITEEIDHHSTEKLRRKMDNEITKFMPRKIVFDFNKVTFMDSAGIGMLIGRYKMIKMLGGTAELINVNLSIKKIFEMCGILKIIPIRTMQDKAVS
jgi:stage II sporulation protein AA (anti-sigma F factor antagonist)